MRKGKFKRALSGALAAMTLMTSMLNPMTAYAAEMPATDAKPPMYEEIKDQLDADEVVKAEDLELEYASNFNVTTDFTKIEIPDLDKVKVTFEEAKNVSGMDFTTQVSDTYKAVYYVEPANTEHPKYQISRNLIVKEAPQPETTLQTEAPTEKETVAQTEMAQTEASTQAQSESADNGGDSGEESEEADGESDQASSLMSMALAGFGAEMQTEAETAEIAIAETETAATETAITEAATVAADSFVDAADSPVNDGTSTDADTEAPEVVELSTESDEAVEFSTDVSEFIEGAEEISAEEFDSEIEATEEQITVDADGTTLSDVMEAAIDEDINLEEMKVGETVTFAMPRMLAAVSTGTKSVSITRGSWYNYSDYGLGSYVTAPYYVTWGGIKATAYCVQPSKAGPDDGTYTISKLADSKVLAKVCYYGTKASDENGFFDEKHPNYSAGMRFVITHLAASLANGSSDWNSGANATGQALARELYNYCVNMPDIPDVEMSFSEDNVQAYIDGSIQRTKTVKFNADKLQTITFKLPSGVKLVNVTTGKTSAAGASVEIEGGTQFYLTAPLTQASNVSSVFSTTMVGSITKDYSAYKITTGSSSQDLALVFGEGVGTEKYIDFTVTWVEDCTVSITKKDAASGSTLAGAVYGIYSDAACTKLITKMPATDANGASSVKLQKTQDTVYLKEITAPTGYVLDAKAHNVKLVLGQTTTVAVTDERERASVAITKADAETSKKLAGAVYGIYSDAACTKLIVKLPATDANGAASVEFDKTQDTVYLKEITAPTHYVLDVKAYNVTLKAGQTTNMSVTDEHERASIAIVKKDVETSETLEGAIYGIYSDEACKNLIIQMPATDKNGASKAEFLKEQDTVYLKEITAPKKYVLDTKAYGVALVAGQTTNKTVTDEHEKARVAIKKSDVETSKSLAGAIYGIYSDAACTKLITKMPATDDKGASEVEILKNDDTVYLKEISVPTGYLIDTNSYNVTLVAGETTTKGVTDKQVKASVSLVKVDSETGKTYQGDASVAGAVYGLYAREDIVNQDGKSGVIYKAGTQVTTLKVDKEGKASVENLYLGKYYLKEITAPTGYQKDTKEYDLDCSYKDAVTPVIERSVTVKEDVNKQPFQVIKAVNNGKTDAQLLKDAGFTAWLVSSLKTMPNGSYDFTSAKPVVLTADGKTEMFTDETGHATSIALPYGKYIVKETTTPHNYDPVDDFIVTIEENKPNTPQVWRVLLDEEFKAKLKVIKKDDETKKSVLIAGTEFKIYDLTRGEYVEQVTSYPSVKTHTSYFTDANGYLILPNNLQIGDYRIEEVNAPEGYVLNQNYVEISVDSNTAYLQDQTTGDNIIEVEYADAPVKGEIAVYKKGEVVTGYKNGAFIYEEQYLAGAEFEVCAAEDIYTADYQKDAEGNRLVVYAKGTLVTTITTNADGLATAGNLPLGKYLVKEKNAPKGFILTAQTQEATLKYADQNTAVVKESVTFTNDRQKVEITTVKQDAENEAAIAGAEFGIYNKEQIKANDGTVIVEADTLLGKAVSDEKGNAAFTLDLPLGQYYVKELAAPAGFVSSDEVINYGASYQGQNIPGVKLSAVKKNEPTHFEFTKVDATTGTELDGASLTVMDKDGNVIDKWTSVKGESHVIKRLVVGQTYTLREEFAPYGYLKATDVQFTVEDTAEIQKVEMKDEVPTALLIINKKGEFLEGGSLVDNTKGIVEHLFEYVSGSLTEVTFEVYAAEDIKAADGVSEDYYKADELIGTITTDDNGIAQIGDLPVGKYYVKEVETAHGYVLDGEPRYVDLSYRDQNTPIVTYSEAWQNNRQKVTVNVLKKEKDKDRVLEGGIFGLFAAEEIKSAKGKVLIEADEIIELKSTDKEGKITFIADLPVDGKYYVKELYAPDGFVTTEEKQEFTFEYGDQAEATVTYDFTFENEPTTVELTKTDITNGEEIPGAHLKVTEKDGNVVDEWTSEKEPHVIKELVVGKEYTLTETKPADGFVTAESIVFKIENTAEIQHVKMEDDITKLYVSKTDITGDVEIPGAKLTILDEDDQVVESWTSTNEPHYVERLKIGKYTLREEQAPKGYILSNDVAFEVADTGEIQKVAMQDDTAKGKVILNKTDAENGEPLKGVEFELRDSNGKVLEKLVTDAAGHAESGLYEIATYKNGEFGDPIKYYLVETKALDGYTLESDPIEIIFEYVDQNTPIIEVIKDLTNKLTPQQPGTPTTPSSPSPRTGDDTNLWLPIILIAVSGSLIAGLIHGNRKKKKQNKEKSDGMPE